MNPETMAYNRDVKGLRVAPPLHMFPGDELISDAEYVTAMSNTYLRKLPFATMLMERFAIPQNNEDQECIKRGLVCMGWLDHMLDEAPVREASQTVYAGLVDTLAHANKSPNIPTWLRPEVAISVALLRNSLAEQPQKNKDTIVSKAQRIGKISMEKATEKDVTGYSIILSEEGALSSDVVIECLGNRSQDTSGYSRLHAFNARAMVAATLLDAAIDLKQDYKDGLTSVEPTFRNRLFLYRKAFRHLPFLIKTLGFKGVLTTIKVGVN